MDFLRFILSGVDIRVREASPKDNLVREVSLFFGNGIVSRVSDPKRSAIGLAALGVWTLLGSPGNPAQAQLLDQLKGAVGSGQSGSGGGVLGGGMPAVGQAGPGNTAGVLQYCIKNNYLGGGGGASSVKDSLMKKVTGSSGQNTNDSGFQAGNSGSLQTGNGQSYSLGGDGLKAQLTQKICDQVLAHGKSLL